MWYNNIHSIIICLHTLNNKDHQFAKLLCHPVCKIKTLLMYKYIHKYTKL